jgi:YlmC/YmxH family sporulation protein
MSFSELKQKEVINVRDGRRLGRPIDLILNERACAEALVVPEDCGFWGFIRPDRDGFVIPWSRIRCIGDDVILVELDEKGMIGGQ